MQSFQLTQETASGGPTPPYTLEDWRKGYESLREEYDYWIDEIEGEIPVELQGTLFRNGPGQLELNGQPYFHPFDGDGMICSIAFQQGRAYFRNRFVRTQAFVEEQAAGRILYRGVFGTQKPGGWLANAFDLRLKNIANTNVIYWGDKLLALWEAAEPYRLNPQTLETIGIDYLDGLLQSGSAFAAHPRVDPACEWDGGKPHLVNFSIQPGLSTSITIYEFNEAGELVKRHSHSVPGFAFIHDFAITPNYCVFFQAPVNYNPFPYLLGMKGAGQCLDIKLDRPTQILIIPRNGTEPIQTLETKAGFVFHHANAFEEANQLYIDSICYASIPQLEPGLDYRNVDFATLAPGQLWRFQCDLQTREVQKTLIEERCCEFPVIHPDRVGHSYRYLFIGAAHEPEGNAPLQAVLKLDLQTGTRQLWSMAPEGFTGEPIFVPRPAGTAEDDGWVLLLAFNGKRARSEVIILDARDLHKPPLARLHLKHHVPYGLHGSFTPTVFMPDQS